MSGIIWDWLLNDFDPKKVELDKCYPSFEEMEPRVKAAFDWLDDTHNAANEVLGRLSEEAAALALTP